MARPPSLPFAWKRAAEQRALRERTLLGLSAIDKLDPRVLAARREVPVLDLGSLPGVDRRHVEHLRRPDTRDLSALTVLREDRSIIVVNDAHTAARQNNSIAHELAHLILEHPTTTLFGPDGQRLYPQRLEDEANWLAACLLVPASGLRAVLARHENRMAVADYYGVSIELLRWRCNANGLAKLKAA